MNMFWGQLYVSDMSLPFPYSNRDIVGVRVAEQTRREEIRLLQTPASFQALLFGGAFQGREGERGAVARDLPLAQFLAKTPRLAAAAISTT